MSVQVRFIDAADALYAEAREVRYEALYAERGLPRSLVDDETPEEFAHLVAVADERVVGYARLRLADGDSKILQVCVVPEARGRGIARMMIAALEQLAYREGRAGVYLDAREHVVALYRGLGYAPVGERFISPRTGTPHQQMRKRLG
ncbi:MAG: GNAT family N-acetyltransferase [Actinomycetota bacterium]|nr:GNAT family N-acetyltransferase [Actinomycetota bacterium]MDZ4180300.1 GNAT family N-acetyltransferase [Coriobacteriia bacterium]